MTETNTALADAIAKCDEIKARLETLREMSEPKPVLRLESITRPDHWKDLQSADDLADCSPGMVIITPGGRFFRCYNPVKPWINFIDCGVSHMALWRALIQAADRGATFKYLAAN